VRDDRPFGGPAPPAVLCYYSRTRKSEHPRGHLAGYTGILQVDRYAGFNEMFCDGWSDKPMTRANCWAHARRWRQLDARVAWPHGRRGGIGLIRQGWRSRERIVWFVISRSDAPPVLELTEQALDEIAPAVFGAIMRDRYLTIALGGDNRLIFGKRLARPGAVGGERLKPNPVESWAAM
jgi:hypothetical protein